MGTRDASGGGVKFIDDTGYGRTVVTRAGEENHRNGRRTTSVAAGGTETAVAAETVRGKTDSGGPVTVGKARDEKLTTAQDDRGCPPSAVTTRVTCSEDKHDVQRSTSRDGGKTPTGQSKNGNRAIVEVLDRVHTPQPSSNLAAAGGGYADGTAFSVLPDDEKSVERACACPECRKKIPRSSSSKYDKIHFSTHVYKDGPKSINRVNYS